MCVETEAGEVVWCQLRFVMDTVVSEKQNKLRVWLQREIGGGAPESLAPTSVWGCFHRKRLKDPIPFGLGLKSKIIVPWSATLWKVFGVTNLNVDVIHRSLKKAVWNWGVLILQMVEKYLLRPDYYFCIQISGRYISC